MHRVDKTDNSSEILSKNANSTSFSEFSPFSANFFGQVEKASQFQLWKRFIGRFEKKNSRASFRDGVKLNLFIINKIFVNLGPRLKNLEILNFRGGEIRIKNGKPFDL